MCAITGSYKWRKRRSEARKEGNQIPSGALLRASLCSCMLGCMAFPGESVHPRAMLCPRTSHRREWGTQLLCRLLPISCLSFYFLSHMVLIFLHFQLVSPVPSQQTFWEGRASWILSVGFRCWSCCDFCYKGLNQGRDHWRHHRKRLWLFVADLPWSLLGRAQQMSLGQVVSGGAESNPWQCFSM